MAPDILDISEWILFLLFVFVSFAVSIMLCVIVLLGFWVYWILYLIRFKFVLSNLISFWFYIGAEKEKEREK